MKGEMGVEVCAPARIDLAGGTIDIWPLYLFHDNAMTVNVAIDMFATVRIKKKRDRRIKIVSRDRGAVFETGLGFRGLRKTPVEFIARIVKFYEPGCGLDVTTDCSSPAGAGLGGSSALAIAVSYSLNHLLHRGFSKMFQLNAVRNIETRILGVPTGVQDYYPALFGGLNVLQYGVSGTKVERINIDPKKFASRLVLCYTGKERSSGVSNWDMVKRYLDGHRDVRKAMGEICAASGWLREAIMKENFESAGEAMLYEWKNRKRLSVKVTNSKIERLMKVALASGATGGKVCGAGGGGCLVFMVREGMKRSVEKALSQGGGRILDFSVSPHGVSIISS
ncbi:MAG: hypothetical protein AB1756_04955 [Acidobacteriota bacterium]